MVSVYMYSVYKDLGSKPGPLREHMERITMIQMERDSELWGKIVAKKMPSFPMTWSTFMTWRHVFDEFTMADPLLCLLFVVKHDNNERKCLVLSSGTITPYPSREDAYRNIFDIQEPNIIFRDLKV